jgi:hypothetical protein
VVLADGFSCRTQIHELDSGGREAMHLAELLATAGGLDHDHPERTAAPPPGPATPDGQGRGPGRNRRRPSRRRDDSGRRPRGGPLCAHPRRRSQGEVAPVLRKALPTVLVVARRGSHTDLMEPRDRPRLGRNRTAELLAQRVAERLIDIVVQAVDIDALLRQVDLNAPLREVDFNALLARVDVNAPLKQVDLNAPLKQVDLNALLKQVDLNALLKQVDLNEVLEQVDVDAVLDRVDINDVVARIDMERLVEQTDLGAIIARSTGGLTTQALDTMRSGAVGLDRRIDRWVTRLLRRKEPGPLAPPALLGLDAQP